VFQTTPHVRGGGGYYNSNDEIAQNSYPIRGNKERWIQCFFFPFPEDFFPFLGSGNLIKIFQFR
jgi:hypothetical protein